jgi:hypothetical protein
MNAAIAAVGVSPCNPESTAARTSPPIAAGTDNTNESFKGEFVDALETWDLVVACDVTTPAWYPAQLFNVWIVIINDIIKKSLPPPTEHRPPRGTIYTHREPRVSEPRDDVPPLLDRWSDLDIEAPVFIAGWQTPCYAPERMGSDEYVTGRSIDSDFG